MKNVVVLVGVALILCFVGCKSKTITSGAVTSNTTIHSNVSAVVSVLTAHGYVMSQIDETAGIVVTEWREDPSANPTGTETRYSAEIKEKTITLDIFARKLIDGKMTSTDSRAISEAILNEIAALVQGEVIQSPSKSRLQQQVIGDDPGDGA